MDGVGVRLQSKDDLHSARKVHHCIMGLLFAAVLALLPRTVSLQIMSVAFLGYALYDGVRLSVPWINDIALRYFGSVMRESEKTSLCGAFYYLLGCLLSMYLYQEPLAMASILFLAIADPVASAAGRTYGKNGPFIISGKSVAGTGAAFGVCTIISVFVFACYGYGNGAIAVLGMGIAGGICGAIAEMLPLGIDDNFTIPVVSGVLLTMLIGRSMAPFAVE